MCSERLFSPSELSRYDGVHSTDIYISFRGRVYDVSSRSDMYGGSPPGPYHVLAGRECARALSTMSLALEDVGREDTEDLQNLIAKLEKAMNPVEVRAAVDRAAEEWQKKFDESYAVIGALQKPLPGQKVSAAKLQQGFLNLVRSLRGGRGGAGTEQGGPAAAFSHASLHPAPGRTPPALGTKVESAGPFELVSRKPRIYLQRRFLSSAECRTLISMILHRQEGMRFDKKVRAPLEVSDEHWTEEQRSLILRIETRLAALTGGPIHDDEVALVGTLTPPDKSLVATGSSCTVAEHLGLHVDTNAAPWRFCTAIIYLSSLGDGLEGGETVFPAALPLGGEALPSEASERAVEAAGRLLELGIVHTDKALSPSAREAARELLDAARPEGPGLRVKPEEGSVCIFWTRQDDGEIDRFSWHGGAPVAQDAAGGGGQNSQPSDWKWTLQKFKEVPVSVRHNPGLLADFVRTTRFNASQG
ncbi:unnamed protein product [Polarella glacialis]|uniref:Cytochrome b5 heme-binding domain-containing protein n=1 Tax=Polarella glacialis TaxID=89957 RepID=A0A813H7K3_POLGL|nr:unnamed protein product [Polarella glacialis]